MVQERNRNNHKSTMLGLKRSQQHEEVSTGQSIEDSETADKKQSNKGICSVVPIASNMPTQAVNIG